MLGGPLIDGDHVAIRWRFGFVFTEGGDMRQEEIAWRTWGGDKIAKETFFYDPGQRKPAGGSPPSGNLRRRDPFRAPV